MRLGSSGHALITGGGSGIGAAIAASFADAGYRLTLLGRNRDRLTRTAASIVERTRVAVGIEAADVTDDDALERAVERARSQLGPVDVLVNNAGDASSAPILQCDKALVREALELNLVQIFTCIRLVVPGMYELGRGRIINIASVAGLKGYPFVSAYCAAKHGVIGLTRALALELAGKRVTVNAICPGYTDTDLVTRQVASLSDKTGRSSEELRVKLTSSMPIGRLIAPREIAAAAVWLASPDAASMTGQAISITGGEYMAG